VSDASIAQPRRPEDVNRPAARPHRVRNTALFPEGKFLHVPRGGARVLYFTKTGQEPNVGSWANGMKLASERLLDQLLMQCLPGFDHEREALGAPLLDARLHPMRSEGIHDQGR
jgi:hypothetical protein